MTACLGWEYLLVDVDWEILPFVIDEEDTFKPNGPTLHDKVPVEIFDRVNANNIYANAFSHFFHILEGKNTFEQGNVEQGFVEADKIIEFTARRRAHLWAGAEMASTVVRWNGEKLEMCCMPSNPIMKKC